MPDFFFFLTKNAFKFTKICLALFPGSDPLCGGMCGFLLHVEKVGTLRFLCSADPLWEEKIQPAPWGHVRCAWFHNFGVKSWFYPALSWKFRDSEPNLQQVNSQNIFKMSLVCINNLENTFIWSKANTLHGAAISVWLLLQFGWLSF